MKPYKVYFQPDESDEYHQAGEWYQIAEFATMQEAVAYKKENKEDGVTFEIRYEP